MQRGTLLEFFSIVYVTILLISAAQMRDKIRFEAAKKSEAKTNGRVGSADVYVAPLACYDQEAYTGPRQGCRRAIFVPSVGRQQGIPLSPPALPSSLYRCLCSAGPAARPTLKVGVHARCRTAVVYRQSRGAGSRQQQTGL